MATPLKVSLNNWCTMEESPNVQTLNNALLSLLVDQCKSQIREFKDGKSTTDSPSCGEIVRRAANGDSEALGVLLNEISKPIIISHCPSQLRPEIDDLVQQVHERLVRKFRNRHSPFRAYNFQAYHGYLNATIQSVATNWRRKKKFTFFADQGSQDQEVDSKTPSIIDEIARKETFQKLLALLTDPLEQEVLRRRIAFGETPDEIIESLTMQGIVVAKDDVYRLAENALRRLRHNYIAHQIRNDLR